MNELQIFNNPDFGEIRAMEIDGEPWFVGKDAAEALGYEKARNAIANYVDEDDALKQGVLTNGGMQEMTIINESGLYSLIFSSRLPKAKEFKRWVTSEILPSIRKTGAYVVNTCSRPPEHTGELARYLTVVARYMEKQFSAPYEIMEMMVSVSAQHGIYLPSNVVKRLPDQLSLYK